MKIDAALPVQFSQEIKGIEVTAKPVPSFANWLTDALGNTNNHLQAADNALQQLASGHAVSLHQTMLTMEQAKLSFQFLEQIRNRLMSAYQDILREQI